MYEHSSQGKDYSSPSCSLSPPVASSTSPHRHNKSRRQTGGEWGGDGAGGDQPVGTQARAGGSDGQGADGKPGAGEGGQDVAASVASAAGPPKAGGGAPHSQAEERMPGADKPISELKEETTLYGYGAGGVNDNQVL